jgi:glycosyltransferase involved in cell wall biosynthesis
MNNFIIITTVYNADRYIGDCINSVLSQDYDKYTLVVVDDASTDGTERIIKSIRNNCEFIYHRNSIRLGSAVGNIVKCISMCPGDGEDVIAIVDGDDWLYDHDVLSYLNQVYQDPNIWLTYGQFISVSGRFENYCRLLTDTINYRKRGLWITSHLKTFKRKLWDRINDRDLRDRSGKYYTSFEDTTYMYPIVEMAGLKHSKFINKILYVYNDRNPLGTSNNSKDKIKIRQIMPIKAEIQKKPIYRELC